MPLGVSDVTDGGLYVAARLAEGSEVVVFHEYAASLVHQVEVKLIVHLLRELLYKGILLGVYIIMVHARGCRETGVHIAGHRLNAVYRDVVMQESVKFLGQHLSIERYTGIEMCSHLSGMHTGIRSTRSRHRDGLAQQ